MESLTETSLNRFARLSGLLYLIVIVTGMFAEVFVRQALNVSNDAMATANKIHDAEMLYRLGFFSDMVNFICGVPVILFFYILFKESHKLLVTLALFFVIISNAVFASNLLNQLHPLLIFGNANYLQSFSADQLAILSNISQKAQSQGYAIGLVFFGLYCIIIGYLIFKTTRIPKLLGIFYSIAGLCYVLHSFIMFLSIGFHNPLFPYILFPVFISEFSIAAWLFFKGIKDHDAHLHKI
jgi:hypothetical protein